MEEESYLALYSNDVNNYISLHFDGSVKRKGRYAESGVLKNKHPDLDVCSDAVVAFLSTGKPLRESIMECQDVRRFIRVRGAKGGATWFRADQDRVADVPVLGDGSKTERRIIGGIKMGRAVRWYYRKDSADYIVDTKSLNKVAGSDGAMPVMELPNRLPSDIDYRYYVTIAENMLADMAYDQENQR
jgi:hypothetical protein